MNVLVRQMTKEDSLAVAAMEKLLFDHPNDKEALERYLETEDCSGLVACYKNSWQAERIAGFLLQERRMSSIHIHRFGTLAEHQRKRVATSMIDAALDGMNDKLKKVVVDVHEMNMAACLLLKSMGFSSSLKRGLFGNQDGIRFLMRLEVLA